MDDVKHRYALVDFNIYIQQIELQFILRCVNVIVSSSTISYIPLI